MDMFSIIKKFIPARGREKINKVLSIMNRVKKLEIEMHQLYPENIIYNNGALSVIKELKAKYNLDRNLNTTISKNDLMYQYEALHNDTLENSVRSYFKIGLNGSNIIKILAKHKFGNLENVDAILDFASGYGRVTRFLFPEIAKEKIWVSDIKPTAVNWQKEHFGVNGFNSSFVPEEINIDRRFNVIFVGSLFSHLPDKLFKRWLDKLYSMLSPEGILVVTVNDISLENKKNPPQFDFRKESEDETFQAVEDRIKENEMYGVTVVGEKYMHRTFKTLKIPIENVIRFPRSFGGSQDIYIINKGNNPINSGITSKELAWPL